MLYNYRYVNMLNGTYEIERYGLGNNATLMTVNDETTAQKVVAALIRETNEMSTDARNEAVDDIRKEMYFHLKDIPGAILTDNPNHVSILRTLEFCRDKLLKNSLGKS